MSNLRSVLLSLATLTVVSRAAAQAYGVIDLGSLANAPGDQILSSASGVNFNGHVAVNNFGTFVADPSTAVNRAAIWTPEGALQALGSLPGYADSVAYGINDRDQVVGVAMSPTGTVPFLWSPESGMTMLSGFEAGVLGDALAVNNVGQVVGNYSDSGGYRPYIWSGQSGLRPLGLPAGTTGVVSAINDLGVCAGAIGTPESGLERAALWTAQGELRDLGTLDGAVASQATGINDAGQVVGWFKDASGTMHAFIWTAEDGMREIDELPGDGQHANGNDASDINNLGQVVGGGGFLTFGDVTTTNTYLWTYNGGAHRLNELFGQPYPLFGIYQATSINDRGQIVGTGFVGSVPGAYLASPVPEPASMIALGVGSLALLRRLRA